MRTNTLNTLLGAAELTVTGASISATNSALGAVPAGYDSIQFYSNHVWRVTPTVTNLIN